MFNWIKSLFRARPQPAPAFFEYLNPYDGPVIEELAAHEIVYAKHQPEYIPLRTLVSADVQRRALSRWTLTPEQRQAIANGADVYLELMTFHNPLQPIRMAVGDKPNPDWFRQEYNLRPRAIRVQEEFEKAWHEVMGRPPGPHRAPAPSKKECG